MLNSNDPRWSLLVQVQAHPGKLDKIYPGLLQNFHDLDHKLCIFKVFQMSAANNLRGNLSKMHF